MTGYRDSITKDINLARHLASRVEAEPDLELAAPQSLSVVCFRYAPPVLRSDEERLNALNKRLLEQIQLSRHAFTSSTTLGGRFVLRACIVNHRAQTEDIDFLVDLVKRTGERLVAEA
jgi:glutamate/tyrosine decarboxylase-like PLP-dependent enzyme